ncbi:MAG: hypothetical protein QXG00_07950 [Candidatus Woesearchaeota archaeon]
MLDSKLANQLNDEFIEIFKIKLFPFYHQMYGFDIIKFEEALLKKDGIAELADGVSLADYIRKKYGSRAENMIKALLNS